MSETHAILRIITSDESTLERIRYYLDEDTRPSFDEDVPEAEKPVFEAIEFAEIPVNIRLDNASSITAWFDFIEEDDLLTICKAVEKLSDLTEQYLFFADDEECRVYLKYDRGKLNPMYSLEDDETIDRHLWKLGWDDRALDWIVEKTR